MSRRDLPAMPAKVRKLRCGVYTRKSTDEGLEREFNSLDAQREACEAFILSQRAEGWVLVHDRYDDGGHDEEPAIPGMDGKPRAGRFPFGNAFHLASVAAAALWNRKPSLVRASGERLP